VKFFTPLAIKSFLKVFCSINPVTTYLAFQTDRKLTNYFTILYKKNEIWRIRCRTTYFN